MKEKLEILNKANAKLERVPFLMGNSLKVIACVSMLIDHLSKIFLGAILGDLFWMAGNGEINSFNRNVLFGTAVLHLRGLPNYTMAYPKHGKRVPYEQAAVAGR